jgi:hypothetical protein
MRTARVRTSGEYRAEVFVIAPPSQGLELPANPERFMVTFMRSSALTTDRHIAGLRNISQCRRATNITMTVRHARVMNWRTRQDSNL